MVKQKPRFGIDIDGTVTSQDTLIPHINKKYNTNIVLDDVVEYDFLSAFTKPIDREEFDRWFKENESYMYSVSELAEGVKPILTKWQHIYELYYISARGDYLSEITINWFHQNGLPYHHIELVGHHDKISIAKQLDVDVFFEDKHDNAVMIAEELKIPVLLFDAPYNRKAIPSNVIRVKNWTEANHYIEKLF